jgi:glucose dehydrogenase
LPIGVFFSGGTLVTQSGLIFVGGIMDRNFRAIDLYTGKELWRDFLPGQAQATPMSYIGPKSKKQFIVITVPSPNNDLDLEHGAVVKQAGAQDSGGYIIAYSL